MSPIPAVEPARYTTSTVSRQQACQGEPTAQRQEALIGSEDKVIHQTRAARAGPLSLSASASEELRIPESRATQPGRSGNPTSSPRPCNPTRAAASPVSLPLRSTPLQLKSSKLSKSARPSKARRVSTGEGEQTEPSSSPHQKFPNQSSTNPLSRTQSPSNLVDESGLRITPGASSEAADRARPKRKAKNKPELTNLRSPKKANYAASSSKKGKPWTSSPNSTTSEEETSEPVSSASDHDVAEQSSPQYPPKEREKRQQVLALIRDGKSRTQIMKKAGISQYRYNQWTAEAKAAGTLVSKRKISNPRYGTHEEETVAAAHAAVNQHESRSSIAHRIGVSRSTLHRWGSQDFKIKQPSSKRPRDPANREEQLANVFALYESGCNDRQVAEATGIPISTVNNWKNKGIIDGSLNLKRVFRQIYSPETRAQAISLLKQGKQVEEVAKTMDINKSTLTKWRATAFASGEADSIADVGKQADDEQSHEQAHVLNEEHTKSFRGNEGFTAVSGNPKRKRSERGQGHAAAATAEAAKCVTGEISPPSPRATRQSSRNHDSLLNKRGTRIREPYHGPKTIERGSPVHSRLLPSARGSLNPDNHSSAARGQSPPAPRRTRQGSSNPHSLMVRHGAGIREPSLSPETLQSDSPEHSGNPPTAPVSPIPDKSPASSDALIHSTSDPWQSCVLEEYWP